MANLRVQTAHGLLCDLRILAVEIVGDMLEVIGGCESPPLAHLAIEQPFDAGIHLGFVDYISSICLFDPSANASAEAIIFLDKPQSGIHHELVRVFLQMRRDLRKLRLLLGSHLDFHVTKVETATVRRQALSIVGLRPSFSAYVRSGEHGAPVQG
jgi:hypothetical protein